MLSKFFIWCGITVILTAPGCAITQKTPPARQKPAAKAQANPASPKIQKQHYDQGLEQYSREEYQEAKKSFERVIALGPNTDLGLKAKENVRKIDQILKTLKEIESK
jgi:TolA-binding protein